MKKNKNIFMASVLLLSLGLASCTDSFLDVTSKTESSVHSIRLKKMLIVP